MTTQDMTARIASSDNRGNVPPEVRASDAERRQVSALLKQACVEGRLTLDEFSDRTSQVLAARTRADLDSVTRDLPVVTSPSSASGAARLAQRPAVSSTVAFLSSAERTGAWRVAEESRVISVMGSTKLDLRRAHISAPVTVIRANVIMGSLNVIVPEGTEVELEATAVMGSRTVRLKGTPAGPGAPVVRIEGFILMGDVTVRDRPSR